MNAYLLILRYLRPNLLFLSMRNMASKCQQIQIQIFLTPDPKLSTGRDLRDHVAQPLYITVRKLRLIKGESLDQDHIRNK